MSIYDEHKPDSYFLWLANDEILTAGDDLDKARAKAQRVADRERLSVFLRHHPDIYSYTDKDGILRWMTGEDVLVDEFEPYGWAR